MHAFKSTGSNRRLTECVRLVTFYQTANASGSLVVTKEMKAFESFAFPKWKHRSLGMGNCGLTKNCCETIWPWWTNFLLTTKVLDYVIAMSFLHWNSKQPSQLNHLVRPYKSLKTRTSKGPGTNFPEIFDDLFTKENSHDKFSMTNETDMPV